MEGQCRRCKHRSPSDCSGELISTFACGLLWLQAKDDSWGSVTGGALTRVVLAPHSGPLGMVGSVMMGASFGPSSFSRATPPSGFAVHPHSWRTPASCPLRRVPRP